MRLKYEPSSERLDIFAKWLLQSSTLNPKTETLKPKPWTQVTGGGVRRVGDGCGGHPPNPREREFFIDNLLAESTSSS